MAEARKESQTCGDVTDIQPDTGSAYPIPKLRDYIETLSLAARPYNALRQFNLRTVGDVVMRTERELRSVQNIGPKSLDSLKKTLTDRGLALGSLPEGMPL